MNVRQWLLWAREQLAPLSQLEPPSQVDPAVLDLEAQVLLAHALGQTRTWLVVHANEDLDKDSGERFSALIARRRLSEPVAYLTGSKEFYSLELSVSPAVLIPRPETEFLAERALEILKRLLEPANQNSAVLLLDVGVGSGALLLATLSTLYSKVPHSRSIVSAVGIDISKSALTVARKNAAKLDLGDAVTFLQADLLSALGSFDSFEAVILLANLPYIPAVEILPRDVEQFEPRLALRGGPDGLDIIRKFLRQLPALSRAQIVALLEVGVGQVSTLKSDPHILSTFECRSWSDFAGVERFLELSNKRG